jgi:general secretion pathway protein G
MQPQSLRRALSLVELIAVVAVLGLLAALIFPRIAGQGQVSKSAACQAQKGDIEIQAELWMHNTGSWPAGDLSDIGTNGAYFPEGLPTCPVDGTAYTINTSTGRVIGHNH